MSVLLSTPVHDLQAVLAVMAQHTMARDKAMEQDTAVAQVLVAGPGQPKTRLAPFALQ